MTEPLIANVSDTALFVARHRALESERPDALFRDPLAAQVAGERGKEIAEHVPRGTFSSWSVALRTVIIDEFITRAVEEGVDTVLNLGAGLDTRPYRMSLPAHVRFIEVDFPAMIDFKESRLVAAQPLCKLERVRMDLSDVVARRALFERVEREAKRVIVLTEGVVPYLKESDVAALADDLASMQNVHAWITDYIASAAQRYRRKFARHHFKNAPFQFDPKDWFAFFEQHGFRAQEKRFLVEEGERRGRPIPFPWWLKALFNLRYRLTPRARRGKLREVAAYVLLVPTRAR
jgi:methyltransferase (TIGR00027 family)